MSRSRVYENRDTSHSREREEVRSGVSPTLTMRQIFGLALIKFLVLLNWSNEASFSIIVSGLAFLSLVHIHLEYGVKVGTKFEALRFIFILVLLFIALFGLSTLIISQLPFLVHDQARLYAVAAGVLSLVFAVIRSLILNPKSDTYSTRIVDTIQTQSASDN